MDGTPRHLSDVRPVRPRENIEGRSKEKEKSRRRDEVEEEESDKGQDDFFFNLSETDPVLTETREDVAEANVGVEDARESSFGAEEVARTGEEDKIEVPRENQPNCSEDRPLRSKRPPTRYKDYRM